MLCNLRQACIFGAVFVQLASYTQLACHWAGQRASRCPCECVIVRQLKRSENEWIESNYNHLASPTQVNWSELDSIQYYASSFNWSVNIARLWRASEINLNSVNEAKREDKKAGQLIVVILTRSLIHLLTTTTTTNNIERAKQANKLATASASASAGQSISILLGRRTIEDIE